MTDNRSAGDPVNGFQNPYADPPRSSDLHDAQETAFEILRELGQGAAGEILLARENHLQREVAFKLLKPHMADRNDVLQRFMTEARIIARLDHPAIVPVYRMSVTKDGRIGYAMKPIHGKTLADLVDEARDQFDEAGRTDETHDLSTLLEHFVKVCDAMHYAHAKGTVHRDLKPDNIMIGPYNEVYVMDWGIARMEGEEEPPASPLDGASEVPEEDDGSTLHGRTRIGTVLGTPRYMSPEQASGEMHALDGRSDQFALGLVLYELVSLRQALRGGSWEELKARILKVDLEPLLHYARGRSIPVELEAIIVKATRLKPEDRYANCQELAEDIRRYLRGEPVSVHKDSPLQALTRWMSHHRQATLNAFLGLLFASALVVGWSLYEQQQERIAAQASQLHLGQQLTRVARQAQAIEQQFLHFEALLGRLVGSAEQLLQHGEQTPGAYFTSAQNQAGLGAPDLSPSPAYNLLVSLDWPVVKLAPGVEETAVEPQIRRLMPLKQTFQHIFSDSLPEHPASTAEFRQTLRMQGAPLVWAFVGTEQGVHFAYPGKGTYPVAFDPRKRPWYTQATDADGVHWLPPYVDISGRGLMVPCTHPLFDDDGRLLGVAGVEMTLQDIQRRLLPLSDLGDNDTRTYLLDGDGRVIVSSTEEVAEYAVGTLINSAKDLELYADPEVLQELAQGRSGHLLIGQGNERRLVVFHRLDALGWYYLVNTPFAE